MGGLAQSMTATSISWPMAQAVLSPELRGSGRALIKMVTGGAGALMLVVSGLVVDQVGVTTMLLLLVPIPMALSIFAWIPMFRAYPRDREALHKLLAQRRAELIGKSG